MNFKNWKNAAFLAFFAALASAFLACKNEPPKPPANLPAGADLNPRLVELSQLIEKNPKNDSLLFLRATLFHEQEMWDAAIQDLDAALGQDSMRPAYFHLLADCFLDYYKSREALRTMESAAKRFPNFVPTQLKLAEFQLILTQHSQALKTIDGILKNDPQNAEAWFMTGQICKDMATFDPAKPEPKMLDRAIVAYKKAVSIEPNLLDAYVSLGQLFAEKKDKSALSYLDNALRIDSTNATARHAVANFYEKTGNVERAKKEYRRIIVDSPEYSDAFLNMGLLLLEQDSAAAARRNFDLAVEVDPLFIKAFYFRGLASEKLKDWDAAERDFEQVTKMQPSWQEAKDALERAKRRGK